MKTKFLFSLTICGVLALLHMTSAIAHHSTSMFDMTREITVNGTVKTWQFVNPHSWLQVVTTDPEGNEMQWSLETLGFAGIDLHKDSFKNGDKIKVIFNPMKNGRPAGILLEAISETSKEWIFMFRDRKPGGESHK